LDPALPQEKETRVTPTETKGDETKTRTGLTARFACKIEENANRLNQACQSHGACGKGEEGRRNDNPPKVTFVPIQYANISGSQMKASMPWLDTAATESKTRSGI